MTQPVFLNQKVRRPAQIIIEAFGMHNGRQNPSRAPSASDTMVPHFSWALTSSAQDVVVAPRFREIDRFIRISCPK